MLNNKKLFNECLKYKVKNIDKTARKILNKIIIPENKDNLNDLLVHNSELIELLTQYNNNYKKSSFCVETIISKIDECLKFEGMNLCPFSQYLMVHDLTYNIYLNKLALEEKKYVIEKYLKDRHQMYKNHNYSSIIFQVLVDNYSHKRKSTIGIEKLKKACENRKIYKFQGNMDSNKYYLLPDSGDKKIFEDIIQHFNIRFQFAEKHQGKMPDIFIKYNDRFIIVEHKKIKETGGGQDKQITEIIEFIKQGERGVNYVSYLDGILFNELINPPLNNKTYRMKNDIINYLSNNPYNYFVNEYGFNKLLDSIIVE